MTEPHLKKAVVLLDGKEIWHGDAVIPDEESKTRFLAMSLLAIAHRIAGDKQAKPQFHPGEDKVTLHCNDALVGTLTLELRDPKQGR